MKNAVCQKTEQTEKGSAEHQTELSSSLCSRFSLHTAFYTHDILLLISTLVREAGTFFFIAWTRLGFWMTHTNNVSLSWSWGITAPITLVSGRLARERGRRGGTVLCCQHHPVDFNGGWWEDKASATRRWLYHGAEQSVSLSSQK